MRMIGRYRIALVLLLAVVVGLASYAGREHRRAVQAEAALRVLQAPQVQRVESAESALTQRITNQSMSSLLPMFLPHSVPVPTPEDCFDLAKDQTGCDPDSPCVEPCR